MNPKHPFVDFYMRRKTKTKKQELILFQVTRQKAEAKRVWSTSDG